MAKDLALIGLHGVEQLTHTQVFKGLLEVPGHLLHQVLSGAKRISDMATHSKLAHWLAEKRDATFAKVGAGVKAGWNGIKDAALHLPGHMFDAGGKVAHGAFNAFSGFAHRAFDGGSRLAHGAFGLGSSIAHRAFDNAGTMAHNAYDRGGSLAHRIFDAGTGVAERLGLDTTLAHKVFNTGSAIANSLFDTGGALANRAFDTGGTIANRAFHNAGGIANRVFDTAGNIANRAFGFGGMIANRAFHNISEIPSRAIDNILHPEQTARRAFGNAGNNAHRVFDNAGSIAHNVFDAGTGLAQRFGIDTTYANRAFNVGGTIANKVFNTGGSIANKAFDTGMGMAKRAASLPGAVMQRVSQLGGFLPTFGPGLLPQPAFGLPGGFSLPGGGLSAPSFGGIAQAAAPIAKTVGSLAGGALGGVTQAAGSAASAVGGFLGKTLGIQFSGQGGHPNVDAGSLLHGLKKQSSGFQPDSNMRGKLGGHLGFDPGGARLHTGPAAAQAARHLNAEAFTIGSDVFFGEGRYDPSSSKGLGLIAHELTHVGQQTGTTGDKTRFFTGRGGDEMEQEAQHVGERVLANAGRSQGVSVGLYDRRYESAGEDELASSDQQRLDMISLMALKEAENLLWQRGIKGRKNLDTLEVNVSLDLSRMSNQEAAKVWAEAIVTAVPGGQDAGKQRQTQTAIQRFESDEHQKLGDAGSGNATLDIDFGDNIPVTYGQMVALAGDYFGSVEEIKRLAGNESGKQELRWARMHALNIGSEPDGDEQTGAKRRVLNRYYSLAAANTSHFSAGGDARQTYSNRHLEALNSAAWAGINDDKAKWSEAMLTEAFSNHFLTDMFSAGHVRTPRRDIKNYYTQKFPNWTPLLLGYVAGWVTDYFNKAGTAGLVPDSNLRAGVIEKIQAKAGTALGSFTVGDIVSGAMHDFDNATGLWVISDVDSTGTKVPGGYSWQSFGDGNLHRSPETFKMASGAVKASLDEVTRVRAEATKYHGAVGVINSYVANSINTVSNPFAALAYVPREDTKKNANQVSDSETADPNGLNW
ncbi:MAG: DUF4157 domain-containing protein, partial [Armatimonadota bacterium]|nr:DUF4157 domain-containing protein [Armatimonadota bacterium]